MGSNNEYSFENKNIFISIRKTNIKKLNIPIISVKVKKLKSTIDHQVGANTSEPPHFIIARRIVLDTVKISTQYEGTLPGG